MVLTLAGSARTAGTGTFMIQLLSGFEVRGPTGPLDIPHVGSRLIAYLALQRRPVARSTAAGVLWPETTQEKAQASMRSALWRVRRSSDGLIEAGGECLVLSSLASVDADTLLDACWAERDAGRDESQPALRPAEFACELLPDWDEDWVLFERERFRLAVLNTLDALALASRCDGRHGEAIELALTALRLEPLRESAHRELVETHLAQGNLAEALRQYRHYRQLLRVELGVGPSSLMTDLIESVGFDPDQ